MPQPQTIILTIDAVYLTALGFLLLLSLVLRTELAGVMRILATLLLPGALILLPLSLLAELWAFSAVLVGCVFALLIVYVPRILPRKRERPADKDVMSLLTFNLQTSGYGELERITDIIRRTSPDVVGFQELSHDAADHFHEVLADQYPHRKLYPQDNAHTGQGIMSRYPIVQDEFYRWERAPEKLGNIHATLDVKGREVDVHVLHPFPPFSLSHGTQADEHDEEVNELLQRLSQDERPTLLIGDFNMTEHLKSYRQITKHFTDAYKAVGEMGLGLTFPDGQRLKLPRLIRLDYVFYDDQFEGVKASVLERSGASDHRPLYAEVALKT